MTAQRLCGIDLSYFKFPPSAEELATIVARMPPKSVALFIALWSEQINFSQGGRAADHIKAIGEAIVLEDQSAGAADDGYAGGLVRDLVKALDEHQMREK